MKNDSLQNWRVNRLKAKAMSFMIGMSMAARDRQAAEGYLLELVSYIAHGE